MQIKTINKEHQGYLITSDKKLMDVVQVHQWLSERSYWCPNVPFDIVEATFLNSFTVGIMNGSEQVGYSRLVTDYAVFGYLADVYVKEEHRGKGLSKAMMQALFEQDWVKGCRRLMLATKDAHGLYKQFGFTEMHHTERFMEVANTKGYSQTIK